MTDILTQKPMLVENDGAVGPYVELAQTQLDELRQLLDRHGVRYWVEEEVISVNEGPEYAVVDFGYNGDPAALQLILDSVP